MSQRPWFPFYPGEYLADTMHLSLEEHGAYLKLLMHAWQHDGLIPEENKLRARILGIHHHRAGLLWGVIGGYWILYPKGYRNKRLDAELAQAVEISEKRRKAAESRHHANADANAYTRARVSTPTPTSTEATNVASSYCPSASATGQSAPPRKNGGGTPFPPVPFEKIQTDYNALAADLGLPQCRILTATRKKNISARWREYPDHDSWDAFWGFVRKQPFLAGQNDRGWRCDLEWLMKPSNFAKVCEGSYLR